MADPAGVLFSTAARRFILLLPFLTTLVQAQGFTGSATILAGLGDGHESWRGCHQAQVLARAKLFLWQWPIETGKILFY